jgi:hypothetical protein
MSPEEPVTATFMAIPPFVKLVDLYILFFWFLIISKKVKSAYPPDQSVRAGSLK